MQESIVDNTFSIYLYMQLQQALRGGAPELAEQVRPRREQEREGQEEVGGLGAGVGQHPHPPERQGFGPA